MIKIRNKHKPETATIAITYRCNAKCTMCNIWKDNTKDQLTLDDFNKLPSSLKDINITGGEPFLRKDIDEIAKVITSKNPKVRLIFSSNGLLTDQITEKMINIKKINPRSGIAISIDGIGEDHSKTRGIDNAYEKAISTIEKLLNSGINDIRIAFTASNENTSELSKVYKLSKSLNVDFTMSIVHNSGNYFNIDTNVLTETTILEKEVNKIINQQLKNYNPRILLRTFYLKGLIDYAKTNKRNLKCYAMDNAFFLDANGVVYPCNMIEHSLGSIKENSFDDLWFSKKADNLRTWCKNCQDCWMVCTVKNCILKEPIYVSSEVLKYKLSSILN